MQNDDVEFDATEVMETVESMKPLLAGKAPIIQGAVLGDLLATWLAGHPPMMREQLIELHIDAVRALVPINEGLIFGERGHPNR